MYELIFLLSDPAFGSLHILHETLKSAAEEERSSAQRPRLRIDDAMVRVRFGAFQVRLRLMPAKAAMTSSETAPAAAEERAADRAQAHVEDRAEAPPDAASIPAPAPSAPPRPELSRRGLRFEMRSDADPQRQHLDDVLWVVTTVASIPGVIVVDQRVGRRS
jgi:hypothetical protein